jgi:hypothetical protein
MVDKLLLEMISSQVLQEYFQFKKTASGICEKNVTKSEEKHLAVKERKDFHRDE